MRAILKTLLVICVVSMAISRGNCAADRPVTDVVLPNGVRIIVQQEPDSQLVAIDMFVRTGGTPEDSNRPGLANFVSRTLLAGTSNQTADIISGEVGGLGGNVNAVWDRDLTQLRSLTLASRFDDSAYLLCDVIKNADFEDSAVSDARQDLERQMQDNSDDVFQQTYDRMRMTLFSHANLDLSPLGSRSVIDNLRPSDLRAFFEKYYTTDNLVISVVGNVDPDHVVHTLGMDLADFNRHSERHTILSTPAVSQLTKPVVVKNYRGDLNAAYIVAGYEVPGAGAKDYPAVLLMNALLGGMKTSLLFTNLREKQGLGYETASLYGEQIGVTDLTAYIISTGDTPPAVPSAVMKTAADTKTPAPTTTDSGASFAKVRDALLDQFRLLRQTPPTDAMLTRAKRYVAGSYLIRHERLQDRAYWLGYSEIALKPLGGYRFDTHFADALNAVTPADIQRVSNQYLSGGYVVAMTLPGDPNAGTVSR